MSVSIVEAKLDPDFMIVSQEALRDPWGSFARVREHSPIFWSTIQKAWMVTTYDDVIAGFMDRRLSSQRNDAASTEASTEADRYPLVFRFMPTTINNLDGLDHARIRPLIVKAFSKPVIDRMRVVTAQVVTELLDECENMREFDFMDIAYRLPGLVTLRILGLPDSYWQNLTDLSSLFVHFQGMQAPSLTVIASLERKLAEFFELLSSFIAKIEATPKEQLSSDLLTALVLARDAEKRLTHEELLAAVIILVAGGFDSTASTSAIFVNWIARRPELVGAVRGPQADFDKTLTELWRYPGVTVAQTRIVAEDFEWHSQNLKKGDLVYLGLMAANTDPAIFDEPCSIRIDRKNAIQAKTFGHGAHICIGMMLAKMELGIFIRQAFERFEIEILQDQFEYWPLHTLVRYTAMNVRFSPRVAAGHAERAGSE
ncbi:MAG TPA: cytochrome P450 [Rhizomicrobium sp.]|nr:cytochrome P450 [Rhizomicrobium sp.]